MVHGSSPGGGKLAGLFIGDLRILGCRCCSVGVSSGVSERCALCSSRSSEIYASDSSVSLLSSDERVLPHPSVLDVVLSVLTIPGYHPLVAAVPLQGSCSGRTDVG